MKLFSRLDRSIWGQWWWTVDRSILTAVLSLVFIGIVMVATASPAVAHYLHKSSFYFLFKHLVFLTPAVAVMLGVSLLSPRWIWRGASVLFFVTMVALLLVLMFGIEIKGARRWLPLLGFSFQPSEFAKPAFAICAAWFMAQYKKTGHISGVLIAAGLYGLCATLLMMQPDFGMTFVLTAIWGVQIFLAGLPLRYVALLLGFVVVGVVFVYMSFGHVQSRIDRFLDPSSGDTYQVEKSLEAFRSGGVVGKGLGQGEVKLYLPDVHSDFIFSVSAEEMGVWFSLLIVGLFGFIVVRGFSRLMESDDIYIVLAAGGLLTMLGLQAFIHMGSALNILPAKGMTLPFVSYGGSSTIAIGLGFGAILALTRRKKR